MSKITPTSFSIDPKDLPPVQFNERELRRLLTIASIDEQKHAAIVDMLKQECHRYMIGRLAEEAGATPKQVHKYLAEVRKATTALAVILDKNSSPAARAVIQHLEAKDALPYGFAEALRSDAVEFAIAATRIAEEVGQVRQGGGKAVRHNRQVRFAKGFIATFEANGWPMEMSHKSLMAQLLGLSLAAVGEGYQEPERLLAAASVS